MDNQKELNELVAINNLIQTEVFQKFIAKPMTEAKNKRVRDIQSFFPVDLKESYRKGGQLEGIEIYMSLIENIHSDLKEKLEDSKGA